MKKGASGGNSSLRSSYDFSDDDGSDGEALPNEPSLLTPDNSVILIDTPGGGGGGGNGGYSARSSSKFNNDDQRALQSSLRKGTRGPPTPGSARKVTIDEGRNQEHLSIAASSNSTSNSKASPGASSYGNSQQGGGSSIGNNKGIINFEDWFQADDGHGNKYYVNKITLESRWTLMDYGNEEYYQQGTPQKLDSARSSNSQLSANSARYWSQEYDPNYDHKYYFNSRTGNSTWTTPSRVALKEKMAAELLQLQQQQHQHQQQQNQLLIEVTYDKLPASAPTTVASSANSRISQEENGIIEGGSMIATPVSAVASPSKNNAVSRSATQEVTEVNAPVVPSRKKTIANDNHDSSYNDSSAYTNNNTNGNISTNSKVIQKINNQVVNTESRSGRHKQDDLHSIASASASSTTSNDQILASFNKNYQPHFVGKGGNRNTAEQDDNGYDNGSYTAQRTSKSLSSYGLAVSELVEEDRVAYARKFERLKQRSFVSGRFIGPDGSIWLMWDGKPDTGGPRFYSKEAQFGGQYVMPDSLVEVNEHSPHKERAREPSQWRQQEITVGSSPELFIEPEMKDNFANRLLSRWNSTGGPVITAVAATSATSTSTSMVDSLVRQTDGPLSGGGQEEVVQPVGSFIDSLNRSSPVRDDKRGSPIVMSNMSPTSTNKNFTANYLKKEEYAALVGKDDDIEEKLEIEGILKKSVDAVKVNWNSIMGSSKPTKDDYGDSESSDEDNIFEPTSSIVVKIPPKPKSMATSSNNDNNNININNINNNNNSNNNNGVNPSGKDIAAVQKDKSSSGPLHSGSQAAVSSEDDIRKTIMFKKLNERAIVIRKRWPWTQLLDMQSGKVFYHNDFKVCFQLETPEVFEEVAIPSDDMSVNSGEMVPEDVNANLLQAFKEENYRRSAFLNVKKALEKSKKCEEEAKGEVKQGLRDYIYLDPDRIGYSLDELKKIAQADGAKKDFDQNTAVTFDTIGEHLLEQMTTQAADSKEDIRFSVDTNIKRKHGMRPLSLFGANAQDYYSADLKVATSSSSAAGSIREESLSRKHSTSSSATYMDKSILGERSRAIAAAASNKKEEDLLFTMHSNDGSNLLERLRGLTDTAALDKPIHLSDRAPDSAGIDSAPIHLNAVSSSNNKHLGSKTMMNDKVLKAHKNIQMLKEYEKEQTAKQIEKNIVGQQVKQSREVILQSLNQLDIETPSPFEKEINKRHLLESITTQRGCLRMPYSLRDAKAFYRTPKLYLCPSAVSSEDVKSLRKMSLNDRSDVLLAKVTVFEKWNIYLISNSAKMHNSVLYEHKATKQLQSGRPFDIRFKMQREKLLKDSWQTYEYYMSKHHKMLFSKDYTLIVDEFGGLSFYCPRRDEYSCFGNMEKSLVRSKYSVEHKEPYEGAEAVGIASYTTPKDHGFLGYQHTNAWNAFLDGNSAYWKKFREDLWSVVALNSKKMNETIIGSTSPSNLLQSASSANFLFSGKVPSFYETRIMEHNHQQQHHHQNHQAYIPPKNNSAEYLDFAKTLSTLKTIIPIDPSKSSQLGQSILQSASTGKLKVLSDLQSEDMLSNFSFPIPPDNHKHITTTTSNVNTNVNTNLNAVNTNSSSGSSGARDSQIAKEEGRSDDSEVEGIIDQLNGFDTYHTVSTKIDRMNKMEYFGNRSMSAGANRLGLNQSHSLGALHGYGFENTSSLGGGGGVGGGDTTIMNMMPAAASTSKTSSIAKIQQYLSGQAVKTNLSLMNNSPVAKEGDVWLQFERLLHPKFRLKFQDLIQAIGDNSNDPGPIMQLLSFLLDRHLGVEALCVYHRALEFMSRRFGKLQDIALSHILAIRLESLYYGQQLDLVGIQKVINSSPDSSMVLTQAARLCNKYAFKRLAEHLFSISLIIDPLEPQALYGYGQYLLESGKLGIAWRYLMRIEEKSSLFTMARLSVAWIQEMLRTNDDALLLAYKLILSCPNKNEHVNSRVLHSLGHYYHIRGDFEKALDFYRRSLAHSPENSQATLLLATLLPVHKVSLTLTAGSASSASSNDATNNNTSDCTTSSSSGNTSATLNYNEEIDSLYRRAIICCKHLSSNDRWMQYLGYGEFILANLGDIRRAEYYLTMASKTSFSYCIWPTIALAHFYQNVKDKPLKALKLLQRCSKIRIDFDNEIQSDYMENNIVETLEETSILLVAMGYVSLDLDNETDAIRFVTTALSIDDQLVSAHRLIGIIYSHISDKRELSKVHFENSIKFLKYENPYCFRSYSIFLVKEKKYEEAIQFMEAAIRVDPLCSLSYRALATMAYLYRNDPTSAVELLRQSIDLCGGVDVYALHLRAQILFELGDHKQARECFQNALMITPSDPVLLAGLALSLHALGFDAVYGNFEEKNSADCFRKYRSLICKKTMQDVIECEDPMLIFLSAFNIGLIGSSFSDSSSAMGGASSRNSSLDFISITLASDSDKDVFFLFGMYLLQRGSSGGAENLRLSKEFFSRAISNQNNLVQPLAMYMLGWVAEQEGNLHDAEKYYCSSMQIEPMDPYTFLKLKRMSTDSLEYVGQLTQKASNLEITRKKRDSKSDQIESLLSKSLSPQDMSFYGLSSSIKLGDAISGSKSASSLSNLRNRENLHQRVARLAQLRFNKAESQLAGLCYPHKFVDIDVFWADRLAFSFSTCDDWSHLLKQSRTFRDKIAEINE